MERLKIWWANATFNEKLMYGLLVILAIGIATRWRFILKEVGEAFSNLIG